MNQITFVIILVRAKTTSSISSTRFILNKFNRIFVHLDKNFPPFKANFPMVSILKQEICGLLDLQ